MVRSPSCLISFFCMLGLNVQPCVVKPGENAESGTELANDETEMEKDPKRLKVEGKAGGDEVVVS